MKATTLGIIIAVSAGPAGADGDGQWRAAEQLERLTTYQISRYQTSDVLDVSGVDRQGAAWVVRTKNRIRGRIMAYVPTAGDPYTLWIVIFNRPSECVTTPCGADADFENPATQVSIYNGSGAISASNGLGGGVINIDFDRLAGKLPNDLFVLFGDPRGLLRNRGFGAEVHLVIDQHASIVPGADSWIADLTTTNFPGEGPAVNVSFAIFLACPGSSCPASVL